MKLIRIFFVLYFIAFACFSQLAGQGHQERYNAIDVLNYRFEIDLNDSSDVIRGNAWIEILFKIDGDQFYLDLTNRNKNGVGMAIEEIREDGIRIDFIHKDDRILVNVPEAGKGTIREYYIKYMGIPADGLIISENKFGDRTFFGDNWPNRAHHWLPVVDHPSDKASVEFLVHAPGHYGIVANGSEVFESHEDGRVFSHWRTTVPLPTKVMVIGVSPFAVQHLMSASGIPVSTWVYPQNKTEGFRDYSIAIQPLNFFEAYIAPYPFSKLANVQSKTIFGGMENASCIFYREGSVTGKQENEKLFAHEIAHQWFGDAASELNWHHIWLSEGFATYLTDLYLEHMHGREVFMASMVDERNSVISYSKIRLSPIIDTTLAVSDELLNTNSYKKAGWVLHMLRRELGDELFQQCVSTFYERFKYKNVLTQDFQKVVESISGKAFGPFFNQWLYQPGHPVLSLSWKYRRKHLLLKIIQNQEQCIFEFPLDIEIHDIKGVSYKETLDISARKQQFKLSPACKPSRIEIDPNRWLLFELF